MRTLRLIPTAMAVLALTVGTTGIAVAQAEATEEAVPAAVSEPPAPSFPTGTFVSVENRWEMLEFLANGSVITHDAILDSHIPVAYAVDGDVYTALGSTFVDLGASGTGTRTCEEAPYRWDYDGERLAFELVGEDTCDGRKAKMLDNTFRLIEDPRVVMVARLDIEAGSPIRALRGYVPAAEVGPDTYTSKAGYLGHVAAVPISKGQPITPDVVTPAE